MSKENKVNPGQYTQRGRLTQDEAAREMSKQRETASPKRTEGKSEGFQTEKPRVTPEDKETDNEEVNH
jgi:hypothetical protein